MKKLDRQLARLIKKYKGKYYRSGNEDIQIYLRVNNFTLTATEALIICFGLTKTPTLGYLLQYLNVSEKEIKELDEITQQEFMTALEEMKVWVDLGTLQDE